jgi:NAD+ synthase (glutamine-hydrolysing)
MRLITVATCSLNQWALDWEPNCERIKQSIRIAKERGAALRTGPELEITGYGCLDHFLEVDVIRHSWEMLSSILLDSTCHGILLDIGMPVMHNGNRYNARIISLDGKILLIRPKLYLANTGTWPLSTPEPHKSTSCANFRKLAWSYRGRLLCPLEMA